MSNEQDFDHRAAYDFQSAAELPDLQNQSPSVFSPFQVHDNPDQLGDHNQSSSVRGYPGPQRLIVTIPDGIPCGSCQISPAESSQKSASTLGYSSSSAHSEQMSSSIFDGKTFCSANTSPSTDHPYHQYSPTYEHSSATLMTPSSSATLSMGLHSIDAVYTQGSAAVHATDQNFCKMIDLDGGMDAYSPSCNTTTDGCKPFENQISLHSPEDCFGVAKDSLDMTTRGMDVSQYAVEGLGNDPSEVTSNNPAGNWSPNEADSVLGLSPAFKCTFPECTFSRGADGRPEQKLKQAVQKHYKRKHNDQNYKCKWCGQIIQRRLDNFRDHIRKKHPEVNVDQYLGTTGKRRQSDSVSYGLPSMSPQHKRMRRSTRDSVPPGFAPQAGPQGVQKGQQGQAEAL